MLVVTTSNFNSISDRYASSDYKTEKKWNNYNLLMYSLEYASLLFQYLLHSLRTPALSFRQSRVLSGTTFLHH